MAVIQWLEYSQSSFWYYLVAIRYIGFRAAKLCTYTSPCKCVW